jgi:hypothetical protein
MSVRVELWVGIWSHSFQLTERMARTTGLEAVKLKSGSLIPNHLGPANLYSECLKK